MSEQHYTKGAEVPGHLFRRENVKRAVFGTDVVVSDDGERRDIWPMHPLSSGEFMIFAEPFEEANELIFEATKQTYVWTAPRQ